jgi:RecT family.
MNTPAPNSILRTMANKYSMEPGPFEATLRATIMQGLTVSREQFAAFLVVAHEHGLNPLTREIYAFPRPDGGIQPIVSIDGWLRIINDNPQCDGITFEDKLDTNGHMTAVTANIWRKDRSKPTSVTEYMAECYRKTSTWERWPRRMLRHKALIQAARYAFGYSGIADPDEAERMREMRDVTLPKGNGTIAREDGRQRPGARDAGPPKPPPVGLPSEAQLVAEVEAGRDDGQQVEWNDSGYDAATEADRVLGISTILRRLEDGYAACTDVTTLRAVKENLLGPIIDDIFPPDRAYTTELCNRHYARVTDHD